MRRLLLIRTTGLPASQVGQGIDTPRGSTTPLSAAFSRQVSARAADRGAGAPGAPPPGTGPPVTHGPGRCLDVTAIDFPPPPNAQAQANPAAGASPAVVPSGVQFGSHAHLNTAHGWLQGWPNNQYQPQGCGWWRDPKCASAGAPPYRQLHCSGLSGRPIRVIRPPRNAPPCSL